MPELPEVETVAADLRRRAVGARIEDLWTSHLALRGRRHVDGRALARAAVGATLEAVRRRGKYLLCELSSGTVLLFHLGMTGNLHLALGRSPRAPHTHLVFRLDAGAGRRAGLGDEAVELRFVDPRRFGLCRVLTRDEVATAPELARMGPEPLERGFSVTRLGEALAGSRRDLKSLLLDQNRVAGIGNIYASEALWAAGIHPRATPARLGPERVARLHRAIREVLAEAIANRGTTFRDFADPAGLPGDHLQKLHVYARAGQPCDRCGAKIRGIVLGQRSTFYCPRCQRV
ncbi:MAG TPA: bifunctional DNA-formamidopyrimidine glycosylase/DNA-(apurinic or apyrimidinic site) lyase [Polyangia bacterium]